MCDDIDIQKSKVRMFRKPQGTWGESTSQEVAEEQRSDKGPCEKKVSCSGLGRCFFLLFCCCFLKRIRSHWIRLCLRKITWETG